MNDRVTNASVVRVRATDGGARLCLVIERTDGEETTRETLTLCTSRLSHTPHTGEIDEDILAHYRQEDAFTKAWERALRSLSYASGSAVQLKQKLRAKGVAAGVADEVLSELEARGLLQETQAAVREAERCLAKCWGNRRIELHLQSKGYTQEAYDAAYLRMLEDDGVARCRKLLQKKRIASFPTDKTEAGKLVAMLMRYGYNSVEIREAFLDET